MTFPTSDILYLDTESTIYETGNPFSSCNRLMCVGTLFNGDYRYVDIEHSGLPYNGSLEYLSQLLNQAKLIVGFNIKYDLHWLRKYCPSVFPLNSQRVYCAQLGEFIISHQRIPYPSLNNTLVYYGLPVKLDLVRSQYWDNGIDTDQVPRDILEEYVKRDVDYLPAIFEMQQKRITNLPLLELSMEDLIVLQEMEYNGLVYDVDESRNRARVAQEQLDQLMEEFKSLGTYYKFLNLDSPFHVSALLYGGKATVEFSTPYLKTFKNGNVRMVNKKEIVEYKFPQLVKPLASSKLKTEGYWSIAEDVLKQVKATGPGRKLIAMLLKQSELTKKISTYYMGVPNLIEKMKWPNNIIHGQFNQVVARTGRLSSSKPNLQNFDSQMKDLFISRFQ